MRVFGERGLATLFSEQIERGETAAHSLGAEDLSGVAMEEQVRSVSSILRIEPLVLRFDNAQISVEDRVIPAEQDGSLRREIDGARARSHKLYRYHIPFDGDQRLLECSPNRGLLWSHEIEVVPREVIFEVLAWTDDPGQVKAEAGNVFHNLRQQLEYVSKEVDEFNASAEQSARQILQSRLAKIQADKNFISALGLPVKESSSASASRLRPANAGEPAGADINDSAPTEDWDVFICHASEDKDAFVRPLAEALRRERLSVWYDEFTLTLGDSLRRSIDRGLARSRFGVVVLSPRFFAKEWPQKELDGLVAREKPSGKVILPIWHEVTKADVTKYSPLLADRVAVSSAKGIHNVVKEILTAITKKPSK